jgi:O-antigen/teichoic acid export membrane protein
MEPGRGLFSAALWRRSRGTLIAIFDQGLLSAANILTGVLAARLLGAASLGALALQLSLVLLIGAVCQSVLATTLMSARAGEPSRCQRMAAEFLAITLLCGVAFGAVAAALSWYSEASPGAPAAGAVAAALLVPAFLMRDYLRWFELAFSRPGGALAIDLAAALAQFALLAGLWAGHWLSLPSCLAAMAAGHGIAAACALARWRHGLVLSPHSVRAAIRTAVAASGWVLAAMLLFLLAIQAVPFLVMTRLGVANAGIYAACAALANAANPMVTGFLNTMMPKAAVAFEPGIRNATRDASAGAAGASLAADTAALTAVAGVTALAIAVWAGPLLNSVYGPSYRPFAPLLWLLAGAFFVRSAGGMPYIGLWALGRAKLNVGVNLASLGITTSAALALVGPLGVTGAGAGVLAAEIFAAGGRWFLFARMVGRPRREQGKELRSRTLSPGLGPSGARLLNSGQADPPPPGARSPRADLLAREQLPGPLLAERGR